MRLQLQKSCENDPVNKTLAASSSHTTRLTSKKRRNHQTWNRDSPITRPMMKKFHHLTRALVLSAVLRWVRSRMTMYCCSSLT